MTAYRRNFRGDTRVQQGRRDSTPAAPAKTPLKIDGDAQLWVTLQRVTDPNSGWVKTTRAMATPAGVLINTCSRKAGQNVAAEALVLVPGVKLTGTRLVPL